ncbi:MBL fold metallo-hydrolase [uncultured Eudoraea sp.]|uniref:MBL fold metallo-hydrolase n=1 Tax=uncultured Eudoraea sp. TaxID=1035614 RepID=UPI00261E2A52|nr:MBL fold metallo-hydrolase [uncultured Eudoraea sp.]
MKNVILFLLVFTFACNPAPDKKTNTGELEQFNKTQTSLIVLGNVQDAGSPHIACKKECCRRLFQNPDKNRKVVSLGVVDPKNNRKYLFDATPDMPEQLKVLKDYLPDNTSETVDGIFLTHAHIGHYTGLMYFGTEAMGATNIAVHAMPEMDSYLRNNGPWSQLVGNKNINLKTLENKKEIALTSNLKVIPFLVPHRDEYSETVGYKIIGPEKTALFIPDIDKWYKWESSIVDEIKKVDYAFLDAGFFSEAEIDNRDISEIPHPTVLESMELFDSLMVQEKNKVWFIHMNHTNPMLNPESKESKLVISKGYHIARFKNSFEL